MRYFRAKRVFDLAFCLVAIPLFAPLLLLCAAAVKIDSRGPVLFSHLRTGQDGKRFRMFKFRTMVENAEERKQDLLHLNILQAPDFKIPDDPRITRVGRVLRRTSLDELPQLFNLLRGEMTLVGPRPTSFAPNTYKLWHTERLEVVPGITGLWQVSGRNEMEFDERLRLDIYYIRHASALLDLKILFRTFGAVLRGSGA